MGKLYNIVVIARDKNNNNVLDNPQQYFDFTFSQPELFDSFITDNHTGIFVYTYSTNTSGNYSFTVYASGEQIGSVFSINIHPGTLLKFKCRKFSFTK